MKKVLVFILSLILLFSAAGCAVSVSDDDDIREEKTNRFVVVDRSERKSNFMYDIMVDTETRIVYVYMRVNSGDCGTAGFTPLLDENGEPMKWENYR